jgi:hypothetical protein
MKTIKVNQSSGSFAENKDIARKIRIKEIMPTLLDNQQITLDFDKVNGVTQSFIHALIAEPIREFPDTFFELVSFRNCADSVRSVVSTVSEYMQESLDN